MELALILRELWSRKALLAVGLAAALVAGVLAVDRISLFPPGLSSRSLSYASARTQVIVDSPDSSLGDLGSDVNPLIVRAGVYSRLLTSPGALDVIGRMARIDPRLIFAQGPYENDQTRAQQEPTAEERSSQIVGEADQYRLRYESSPDLPMVTIFSQAPTTAEADRLANGAAQGLGVYVRQLQDRDRTPPKQRVEIRQLGTPFAKTVNGGVGQKLALLVFVLVFALWCAGMLVVSRLVASWRAAGDIAAQGEDVRPHPVEEPQPATALVVPEHNEVSKALGRHPVQRVP